LLAIVNNARSVVVINTSLVYYTSGFVQMRLQANLRKIDNIIAQLSC
jgi:hypothetical protein